MSSIKVVSFFLGGWGGVSRKVCDLNNYIEITYALIHVILMSLCSYCYSNPNKILEISLS